jgi:hypothetical protein
MNPPNVCPDGGWRKNGDYALQRTVPEEGIKRRAFAISVEYKSRVTACEYGEIGISQWPKPVKRLWENEHPGTRLKNA